MKQNLFLGVVFGVTALTVSCNKLTPQTPGGTPETTEVKAFNRLMAGVEQPEEEDGGSKTILRSSLNVNWVDADKIKVFDDAGYSLVFGTSQSDVRRAAFFCDGDWAGDAPVMAVHMEQTNISGCVPITVGGKKKYKARISNVQDIVNYNSYCKNASVSMGRVALSGDEYEIETMKNMFSLVQFDIKSPNIKSVTLEAKDNATGAAVPLAGWVELNYNEGMPTCLPSSDSPVFTTVTVRPKGVVALEGGTFTPASHYLFSVIPQTPDDGITVYLTLENADGKQIRRTLRQNTNGEAIKFVRNRKHVISTPLDHGVTGCYDQLVLEVDFSSAWPFDEACVARASQSRTGTSGESYTFGYTDTDDVDKTCTFEIGNAESEDSGQFYYSRYLGPGNCLRFENVVNGSWIKVPAVPGRQLRTIELTCYNSTAKNFRLNSVPSTSSAFGTTSFGGTNYTNLTNSYTNGALDYDTAYYIVLSGNNVQLTHMTLTYEKF